MKTEHFNASTIAKNIRHFRLNAKLTQLELARKLHVSISSVNSWENGRVYPSLINILFICNLFDVKVDTFIGFLPLIGQQKI